MIRGAWNFLYFFVLSFVLAQDPIANLPQGRAVGIKVYTENSLTPVEIFFGIPYAKPPVGRHRFSAPERHTGWRRTFFAHRMPPKCPQISNNGNDYVNEDCLFLNIWTPRRVDGSSLPVVVVLYSESWEKGGISLPYQELAAEGVVVVTVAYRLNLLSFFTLRTLGARGNLALLDQYLALLWVRENIAAFGGDPTAITLLGHSAGADSVLYHIASPRSIGLIQRAIVMSPLNIWRTLDKDIDVNATEVERISLEMARSLGCSSDTDQEILQCMRARSIADIMSLYSKVNRSNNLQPIPDDFLPEAEQFLPTPLSVALSAGKQPMQLDVILGTTDLDDINSNGDDYDELLSRGGSYIAEYANTKAIPEILRMFSLHRSEALPLLLQAIRWEYWGAGTRGQEVKDTLESLEALARMKSSAKWGAGGALLAARLARRVSRLYVYRYTRPGINIHGRRYNFTGAVHGTDLVALLGDALMLQIARRPTTQEEKRFSTNFRKYIANFIKFGSPAPEEEWQRYKVGNAHIHEIKDLNIDDGVCSTKEAAFWLQYLPQLSNLLSTTGKTEQLTSEKGESRLRGGVFALCGVSVVLLLLLLACTILLHRERSHRSIDVDSHLGIQ
ncbi:carboxylesterase 1C [Hyposmocoma kahamanoa]|uniref:carboxylesterase 1C n=1 Tax=Hyposmocoma kahamanoa TaxID=1477025 RepID=UPI000E6D72E3|nr:carboxylesterase 1C [Hyposmocoma kahamanoa]